MTFFTIRYSVVRAVRLLLFLLLLTTACNAGENSANSPQDLDNEPVVGGNASDGTKSSDGDEISEATKEFPTATPTTPAPEVVVVDLLDGLDQGSLNVRVTNGSGLDVEVVVQNLSEETISVESQPGLLVADDDPETVDLVLPGFVLEEIPAGSEASGSIPAYHAAYAYPIFIVEPGVEITPEYFYNPAPLPGTALTIVGVDSHLGTILEAADLNEFSTYQAIQVAVLAVASDILASTVNFCGSTIYYAGWISQGSAIQYTTYWLDCNLDQVNPGIPNPVSLSASVIAEARELLRMSALLNEELATPFRIALRSTNPAFSDEKVAAALVALVDQDPIIERFGFGVTFHLLATEAPPEGGVGSLPEITVNGMSVSEAQVIIADWIEASGGLEFSLIIGSGDQYWTLFELVVENWYEAGISPEIVVVELDYYYSKYLSGQFDDAVLEHRPGLLP